MFLYMLTKESHFEVGFTSSFYTKSICWTLLPPQWEYDGIKSMHELLTNLILQRALQHFLGMDARTVPQMIWAGGKQVWSPFRSVLFSRRKLQVTQEVLQLFHLSMKTLKEEQVPP